MALLDPRPEKSWAQSMDEAVLAKAFAASSDDGRPRLVDTTMLFAPRSGGVKRYLTSKARWLASERPGVSHRLVVPGRQTALNGEILSLAAPKLPFGDGYRWPTNGKKWARCLQALAPDILEAGDPYVPGQAALEAGQALGVPVVGFCHSDPAALAALHFGEWAKQPVQRRWAKLFCQFDTVISPSHFIARRLAEAGVRKIEVRPLGVDVDTFNPARRDREWLVRQLGIEANERILVFAGRPAREKNVDLLIEAVQALGAPYRLVLVGAGQGLPAEERVISLPFERDPLAVARVLASADVFVHANPSEPFGLIVLEAMASGRPVVGINSGGVAETVTADVGALAHRPTVSAYAEAIQSVFEQDLDALGRAARDRALALYHWPHVFAGIAQVYARLTGRAAFDTQAPTVTVN